jgi:uncharacterized protein DUF4242
MFVVDRTLPGISSKSLAEVQRLLLQAARRVSSAGEAVRYLRCIYLPQDARCICLFEADDLAAVRRVNAIAQVPFRRISRAIEFWTPGVDRPPEKAGQAPTDERPDAGWEG